MTALIILFIVSGNIIYPGLALLKELYEGINELIVTKEKLSWQQIIMLLTGLIFVIVGAILYYQVCAATIENIVLPRRPVEEPVLYGIAMIFTSLIFTGGAATSMMIEGKLGKILPTITTALLIIYLALKAQMVLP